MKVVTVEGEKVRSKEEILTAIRETFQLPADWNADRVYGFLAGVTEPATVVVTDSVQLRRNLGADARALEEALAFAEQQNSRYLSVLFVD